MDRRSFLKRALGAPALLTLVGTAWLQACGDDAATPTPTTVATPCDGAAPDSMDLHIHPLCVSAALLATPVDSTLTLQAGNTGHTHTLALTAAQITAIRDNTGTVFVNSSFNGHAHIVTFLA